MVSLLIPVMARVLLITWHVSGHNLLQLSLLATPTAVSTSSCVPIDRVGVVNLYKGVESLLPYMVVARRFPVARLCVS